MHENELWNLYFHINYERYLLGLLISRLVTLFLSLDWNSINAHWLDSMDGNGWYGDRYKNDGQSVHFFDFNEIKTEIRYRQHKKHKHTHIQRYREWSVVHLINVLLSTNVIMNKRYYARWNIISYIKMHFNQLRQLFYPLFMARICLCLCYGVCSLSSLFRALVSCCFGSFRFHLFLFWKNWVEKKYVVLAFYFRESPFYGSWMHSPFCTFFAESCCYSFCSSSSL